MKHTMKVVVGTALSRAKRKTLIWHEDSDKSQRLYYDKSARRDREGVIMAIASALLSPVKGTPLDRLRLGKNELFMLDEFTSRVAELVKPMVSLVTRQEVDTYMDKMQEEFLHLYSETWHIIKLPESELIVLAIEGFKNIANLLRQDTKVLNPEEKESLLDFVESRLELLEVLAGYTDAEQSHLADVIMECSSSIVRADMCLVAITLVVTEEIHEWHPKSIKLLSDVAGEYMLRVEDVFLSHDKELNERLRAEGERLSLEELEREIGLRD